LNRQQGKVLDKAYEHSYGWLRVFDKDELQDFIKEESEGFR
jgi:hypothetical protein